MTRQQPTGAVPATSPAVHQCTRHQIPAVSFPLPQRTLPPQAGRPATKHGGAGEPSPRPRPRRAPLQHQPRRPVTIGGPAWQS